MNVKLNVIFTILSTVIYFSVADGAGLSVVPMPDVSGSTLIYYKASNRTSVMQWANVIDGFLAKYRNNHAENAMYCSYEYGATGNKVCDVSIKEFYPCDTDNQYNYWRASPCVFLKLDNILDWTPELYNNTKDLPEDMPEDLKKHIEMVSGKPEANEVWVTCKGENPVDVELLGPIIYLPRRGFPSYYYPFTNKDGYLSPLVAVQFQRPTTSIVMMVECRAWAKNIDSYERRGSVHFELLVDF